MATKKPFFSIFAILYRLVKSKTDTFISVNKALLKNPPTTDIIMDPISGQVLSGCSTKPIIPNTVHHQKPRISDKILIVPRKPKPLPQHQEY